MAIFQQKLLKAEFLDAVTNLQDDLLKLGTAPYGPKVYDYAIKFFTVLRNFKQKNNVNKLFYDISDKLSQQSLAIFLFNARLNEQLRAKNNEEITLDKIYLQNNVFSLKELREKPNQPIVQINIQQALTKTHNDLFRNTQSLLYDLKHPNKLVLKIAGYKNQKTR